MEGGKKKIKHRVKKTRHIEDGKVKKVRKTKRFSLPVKVSKEGKELSTVNNYHLNRDESESFLDEKNVELYLPQAVKTEREKTILMWSGVIFFTVVIFFFWAASLKESLKNSVLARNDRNFDWNELSKNLDITKEQLQEIKEVLETKNHITASSTINTTVASTSLNITQAASTSTINLDSNSLKNIEEKIIKLETNSDSKNN